MSRDLTSVFISIGLLLAAAGSTGCDKFGSDPDSTEAAAKPLMKKASRTIEVTKANAAEGAEFYEDCASCHGAKGEGKVGMAPSLVSKSFLEAASDEMLVKTISGGRIGTTMIAWNEDLEPKQIEAVVAYLRSLNPTEPANLNESPLNGDTARGEAVFMSVCVNCHGRAGAGYQESGSGTGIGRKVFLDVVSDGYLRHIIKNGKSGTAMGAFDVKSRTAVANLTDQEIEDTIVYLRKNAW
jgi:cytochrome c oxidase cbb3-type subunit III